MGNSLGICNFRIGKKDRHTTKDINHGDFRAREIGSQGRVTCQVNMPKWEVMLHKLPLQRSQSWNIPE
jgi:hypothetical protein